MALAALTLAACSADPAPAPVSDTAVAPIDRTVAPLEPATTVSDPAGQRISLPAPPRRIVCLSGLCDDLVVELGMVPAGTSTPALLANPALLGDRAAEVPVVAGTFGSEDVESIAALQPDLVIGLTGVH
ncbi:ABC transporter substrate-binding protein [Pseudonocardia nigra]|uniref:ABC transporter substrate-binding protein n=1 Tax=Pseudonocardia nigra TaxID=1921578 RepID=UPI001FE3411F|nr:ABC transporter substrate-binding protein [Pseudonocardia nigra]